MPGNIKGLFGQEALSSDEGGNIDYPTEVQGLPPNKIRKGEVFEDKVGHTSDSELVADGQSSPTILHSYTCCHYLPGNNKGLYREAAFLGNERCIHGYAGEVESNHEGKGSKEQLLEAEERRSYPADQVEGPTGKGAVWAGV